MLCYQTIPVPESVWILQQYFEHGVPLEKDDFFYELVTNDLRGVYRTADLTNASLVYEWVKWMWQEAPCDAWGSVEKYESWLKRFNKVKRYRREYNVPALWIEVYSESRSVPDFEGDSPSVCRILLGWRHDGVFTSIDKCPLQYIKEIECG